METIEIREKKPIDLFFLGDFHIGNKACNIEALERDIALVRENKNARVILMGDFVEGIDPKDKRFNIDDIDEALNTITRQHLKVRKLLRPIKDKIYAIIEGNHEFSVRSSGYDITEILSEDLNVPNLREGGLIKLFIRDKLIRIAVTHGSGSRTVLVGAELSQDRLEP